MKPGLRAGPRPTARAAPGPARQAAVGRHTRASLIVEREAALAGTTDSGDLDPGAALVRDDPFAEQFPDLPLSDEDDPAADPDAADRADRGEPDPYRGRPLRVEIAFCAEPRKPLVVQVRNSPLTGDTTLDTALRLRHARLLRTARTLADMQEAAIRAPDLPGAYLELRPLTQAELARRVSGRDAGDGAKVSRERNLLVRINAGLVPLAFFCWHSDATPWLAALWRAGYVRGVPDRDEQLRARQFVAGDFGVSTDRVRRHEDALLALRAGWPVVRRFRRDWPLGSATDLLAALGVADRGETAARLALLGVLQPPADAEPQPVPLPMRMPVGRRPLRLEDRP